MEARNGDLCGMRDEWLASEVEYTRMDENMGRLLQHVLSRAMNTKRVQDAVARREAAQRYAQRLKVRYRQQLNTCLHDAPPDGFLDRILTRHMRSVLRLEATDVAEEAERAGDAEEAEEAERAGDAEEAEDAEDAEDAEGTEDVLLELTPSLL